MTDIDEIQTLGEVALKTLTQLWRQLPRLDHEAGKKLGDEVTEARKAIEKLVRIGCEAQMTSIPLGSGDEKKLYEPLPFTTGQHNRANRQQAPGHVSPSSRSDSSFSRSPSGISKQRPAFPNAVGGRNVQNSGDIELDEELNSSSTNNFLLGVDPHAETVKAEERNNTTTKPKSPSSFSKRTVQNNNSKDKNTFLDEAAIAADYERFKRDLGLPAGLNYYDDPAWIEMMKQYSATPSGAHNMTPSRLSLMVQLALRRELMWRLHARMLQMQGDRDSLGEIETKDRCEIEIECTEAREELVAQMQGVKLMLIDDDEEEKNNDTKKNDENDGEGFDSGDVEQSEEKKKKNKSKNNAKSKKALVFENIRRSFQREQDMKEMNEKCEKMDDEKSKLADEVSKLTKEVMKLAKENTSLTKKAASPSQALHPEQLAGVLEEIAKLRRQVDAQEEELQALGV